MIENMPTLITLLQQLQQVPYLASKNIYRVAHYFLMQDQEKIAQLCASLMAIKHNINRCEQCCVWKEKNQGCWLCSSTRRDNSIICVVETWHELLALEKTGAYSGLYHVLGGAISPLDGIGPEDLSVDLLLTRCLTPTTKEIILAMNQTPEGEATSVYLALKIKKFQHIKISCLAKGVPVGSSLEFMDRLTIYKALSERRLY